LFHPIRGMEPAPPPGGLVPDGGRRSMGQTAGFQETLRGVALIGEGFAEIPGRAQPHCGASSVLLMENRAMADSVPVSGKDGPVEQGTVQGRVL